MGAATRDAFGETLAEAGEADARIVVVDGDVADSTRTKEFMKRFPTRAWNVGIAESNLIGVSSGLAASGKLPVVASFACFLLCNAFDQIRMGIAFPGLNVKLVGSHGGISPGEDGPSQMAPEDVALACGLGGFTVVVPADAAATKVLTRAMLKHEGPVYMRTGRPDAPVIYESEPELELGKAQVVRDGGDVTLVANGLMVAEALDAADELAKNGVEARVLDMHTVKPIDAAAVRSAADETKGIVVAEEHFAHGGLGAAVSMAASTLERPPQLRFVNIGDSYSTSGKPMQLFEAAGITTAKIVKAAQSLVNSN
jgi:transketolase